MRDAGFIEMKSPLLYLNIPHPSSYQLPLYRWLGEVLEPNPPPSTPTRASFGPKANATALGSPVCPEAGMDVQPRGIGGGRCSDHWRSIHIPSLTRGPPPSSLQAAGSDPCGRMKEASKVTRVGRMGQQVGKVNKLQRAYCSGDRVSSSDGRQKNIWVLCPAEGERPGPSNLHYRKRKTSMSLSRGRSNSMTMAVETRLKYLAGLISTMRHSVSKNAV